MTTDISTRLIPVESISDGLRQLGANENSVWLAMQELADWCIKNQNLLEQGRKHGFRLGASPMVKDIIALACSTPGQAARIAGNLQDVPL